MSSCRLMVLGACLTAILIATASRGAEQDRFDPVKQFDHIGIFTAEKMPGARLVEASRVWVTDIAAHPFRVEWLCVDDPAKRAVLRSPHVAFRVHSIAEASKGPGLKSCSAPFEAGIARVGFCQTEDGATVEFMEYHSTEDATSQGNGTQGDASRRSAMQFDHVGFITDEKKPGERFVPATKVWVTDIASHPYRVEWLRFEPDSPVTGPVRNQPHVAFRVDSIAEAAKGLKVLLEPFDAGIAKVGFYQTADGAVVEFMEYYKTPE
ncbi:MAG: hypothetical protein U1E05_28030 [Patescibacteria group bacterium]|nr:hypothetical protein [Patescibacteria group bacterium]